MATRVEFSQATKNAIAGRAGYRCSFPACRRVTIGPGKGRTETESIGAACHIYSAAPDGPRGRGDLSEEELASVENGFWACRTHATLVDTNDGNRYPAATLIGWRNLHEARIRTDLSGARVPVHWIQRLEVRETPPPSGRRRAPLFKHGEELHLARVTLLIGGNGSGKSALCDWISASASSGSLSRWESLDFAYTLTIHSPDAHVFDVDHRASQPFTFRLDGLPVAINPLPVTSQTVGRPPPREGLNEVEWLGHWLNLTRVDLQNLARVITTDGNPFFDRVEVRENDVRAKLPHADAALTASQLSGGEEALLGFVLALARARCAALQSPTLLVLDQFLHRLDATRRARVLDAAMREEQFQTIVTEAGDIGVPWGGWSVVHLEPGPLGTVIRGD